LKFNIIDKTIKGGLMVVFKCPKCSARIKTVKVIARSTQTADIDYKGRILEYLDDIRAGVTEEILCPKCNVNIRSVIKE
jgi:uncharacterized protein (UPF0212 family)